VRLGDIGSRIAPESTESASQAPATNGLRALPGSHPACLPSCSAAEALDRQGPFVNPTLSNHALALLARLFHYGTVSYHGGFVGLLSLATVQALRWIPGTGNGSAERSAVGKISKRNLALLAEPCLRGSALILLSETENRVLQPDILIVLRTDSKRVNEYSSEFSMENTTG
jgi:hypothetical protein